MKTTVRVLVLAIGLLSVGCGRKTSDRSASPNQSGSSNRSGAMDRSPAQPLHAMNSAIRRGQWPRAWELSDAVLAKYPDDAKTIAMVARVAHENKRPDDAAKLLARACRAESFQNGSRVQQTMIAMVGVGRLHDGMDLLEEAIERQPLQHESRRWLYDFYMGTENRSAGVPHGRFLVRNRNFDLELLLSLSNTERRTQESKPLEEMIARNPDDQRPQLGVAKARFDEDKYDQSIRTLQSIVQAHPEYLPAQALLGRALAASGQYDELEQWSQSQTARIEAFSGYWIALGDWAREKGQSAAAARAYWEAVGRDPDVMEAWSKLSASLKQLNAKGAGLDDGTLESVDKRVELLSEFNQLKNRFERTGSISREIAIDLVHALRDLGRLWEAEAWASVASTLPEDDSVSIDRERDSIVAMLRSDTPWQLTDQHPELQLDLTNLALPTISTIASVERTKTTPTEKRTQSETSELDAGDLSLIDEAIERGLTFFGRTGDQLDEPGIMLYQTLGCGGGTIDFDLDGWNDLYLVAAGGTPPLKDSAANALFRNLAGRFSDVTASGSVGDTGFGQGVAVGDVNEDGFPDLLVLNYGPNALLINNGDGTFSDASDTLGGQEEDWSTSGAIGDCDGDGLSDLVIVNYCAGTEPVTTPCPMKDSDVARSCTPMMFASQSDAFLQSSGNGAFVDRTVDWNAQPSVTGRGLGVIIGALDRNAGIDIFIANDMTNNHYWSRALGEDRFGLSESAMPRGLACDDRSLAQGSMGIAAGDYDQDGDIDIYVTNFDKEYNTFHEQLGSGYSGSRQSDSGQLVSGIWQDRTSSLQLVTPTMPLVGFGTQGVDLDNDGTLEVVVSNGHVDIFSRGEERSLYAQPMQVFRRNQRNTYDSIGDLLPGPYLDSPHVGRALWTLDANRDGLTDLAVTHQTEPVALLINHSRDVGDWLEVNLVGRSSSRDAIGAVVEVTSGDQQFTAIRSSGQGYLSSNETTLRFGLADTGGGCDIKVTWPDGAEQVYRGLQPNNTWLFVQDDPRAFRQ